MYAHICARETRLPAQGYGLCVYGETVYPPNNETAAEAKKSQQQQQRFSLTR